MAIIIQSLCPWSLVLGPWVLGPLVLGPWVPGPFVRVPSSFKRTKDDESMPYYPLQ